MKGLVWGRMPTVTCNALMIDDEHLNRTRRRYAILTYLGALPFIGCALLLALDVANVPYLGAPREVARVYGLVIVSFMAGAHWGQQIILKTTAPINLHMTSISIALCAWISHLLLADAPFMIILIALFAWLLAIDFKLNQAGVIDRHYFQTRCIVTGVVICAVAVVAFSA